MDRAETELKKVMSTSTVGSKETVTSESKSPTANKIHPVSNSAKIYKLYNNLKFFAFCMPEGWDDRNITIFLECCKESIEDFQMSNRSNQNEIWHKIAKLGSEKSGRTNYFTVNSCLELSQCLKDYIIKNMNMMDNVAFKELFDDMKDLLQYFPSPPDRLNKIIKHHSQIKSTKEKGNILSKNISLVKNKASTLSQKVHMVHKNGMSVKIKNSRPKKPRKTGSKSLGKVMKSFCRMPVKQKTINYNISEEEKSPPPEPNNNTFSERCPTHDFIGFVESSSSPVSPPYSPIKNVKRIFRYKTMDSTSNEESLTNKKCLMNSAILPVPKKKCVQQTPKSNAQINIKNVEVKKPFETLLSSSKMNPVVVLERIKINAIDIPPVDSFRAKSKTLVKTSIVGQSGLMGIVARNSVCHNPDSCRMPHQENIDIPVPSRPSSSSYNQNATKPISLKINNDPTGQSPAMEVISHPPEWFQNFINNYKRHDAWKMKQILKMQDRLVDVEFKKLAVLENILTFFNKDKV